MRPERASRIAVVTAYDHAWAPLGAVTSANKRAYCLRHGYSFIEYMGDAGDWHPAWLKLAAIDMGFFGGGAVFWSDADSIIVNPEVKLEDLYDPQATITITDDGMGLNAGNFFVNPMPLPSVSYMKDVGNTGDMFLELMDSWRCRDDRTRHMANLSPWEQRAMQELYDDGAFEKYGIAVSITDQRKFNSYDRAFYERGTYEDGDFLLHYPGQSMQWKLDRITDRLAKSASKTCLRNCRKTDKKAG